MLEFTSSGSFEIKRHGTAYTIVESLPEGMWNPQDLVGMTVKIDDKERKVKAVERFMIAVSPENPYRLQFALLVD